MRSMPVYLIQSDSDGIIDLTVSNVENAVIDSFIVKACKHTTAQRR